MKKNLLIIIGILVILAICGGSFYGGMLYSKSQNVRPVFSGANGANFQGARTGRTGAAGGGMISGSIISKDNNSITLQMPNNGGSKIIFYSDTTQISKSALGSASDLANGVSISVTGTTNSDGSVTAQSIRIGQIPPK